MNVYYVSIAGYYKRSSKWSKAYSAIVLADSKDEAKKKIFERNQWEANYLSKMLRDNPRLHLDITEVTSDVFTLKVGV